MVVKWREIDVNVIAVYCRDYFERYEAYPSLRDIFYRFVDELWPNTKSVYKRLSTWLRDKRIDGSIDWRIIRDGASRMYESGDDAQQSPREHVSLWFKLFLSIANSYRLPRWLNQPKMVCVISEKEADYPVIKYLVGELNADTAYVRGYSGWRMMFEMVEDIKEAKRKPVIIALSDFDPSGGDQVRKTGKDLVSFILKALNQLGIDVEVEKVAVTKEQIEKFSLPHIPMDAAEIAKLKKDPRFKTWPHGIYRCETAALRAKAPDYFDDTIRDAVRKHFDEDAYEVVKKAQEAYQEQIEDFMEEQADLLGEFEENLETDNRLEY